MNNDETVFELQGKKKKRVSVGTVFKIIVFAISLFIYGFFLFRLCTTDAPMDMREIFWNDVNREAYLADPVAFKAYDQEPDSYIAPDGSFWVSDIVYMPDAKQIQLTIKYNDSTLKALKKQLGNENMELPAEPFDYSLTDNEGNRYPATAVMSQHKQNYNYRRIVCENIDMSVITDLYIDMYSVNAVDYTKTPHSSLKVWDADLPTTEHNVRKELPTDLK